MSLPPYKLITTNADWQSCLARFRGEPRLAVDLEANSLYAYWEKVCLIQISTPALDFIIDPVAGFEIDGLGEIISDPKIEKIFHAAEYDLILLKKQYGWELRNLFDTMWAARILGYARCGLANVLKDHYGVKLNKRYQKANWCRRPLKQQQLVYAQMDTHYLLRLRDDLAVQLVEASRMDEAQETFAEQCQVKVADNSFDPDSFWSISGVRNLKPHKWAVAKALHIYRNQQAKKLNRPAFKIFDDKTLLELSRVEPLKLDQLPGIYGMSKGQIRRYGRQLIRVIREAQQAPTPAKPRSNNRRPPDAINNRYERLHAWRKSKAMARGVESDVIISRDVLWDLARANPESVSDLEDIETIGPWRLETYGNDILQALHGPFDK